MTTSPDYRKALYCTVCQQTFKTFAPPSYYSQNSGTPTYMGYMGVICWLLLIGMLIFGPFNLGMRPVFIQTSDGSLRIAFINIGEKVEGIQQGTLLEANLVSGDIFDKSKILIIRHGDSGTMGLIINKGIPLHLEDHLTKKTSELKSESLGYNLGGPVQFSRTVYYLHDNPKVPSSIEVAHGLYFSQNLGHASLEIANKGNILFGFHGIAQWSPGQLYGEIHKNVWSYRQSVLTDLIGDSGVCVVPTMRPIHSFNDGCYKALPWEISFQK